MKKFTHAPLLCMLLFSLLLLTLSLAGCNAPVPTAPVRQTPVSLPNALATPDPSIFKNFVGTWYNRYGTLTIEPNGHAKYIARVFTWCGPAVTPPCDSMENNLIIPGIHLNMIFAHTTKSMANGTVLDGNTEAVGSPVSLTLLKGNRLGFSERSASRPHTLCASIIPVEACGV
jgi:hypothetical protein